MFFRTSSPWKLETFTQNFWSSYFFGTWFFRIDVLSCRLLSCHVLSCHDLQNFKPVETGDVHSELLVFRLLWHLVLQSLRVLNAGDVHQNFCLQKLQALDQKHTLHRLGLFIRTSCLRVFRSFWANLQNMLTHMIF